MGKAIPLTFSRHHTALWQLVAGEGQTDGVYDGSDDEERQDLEAVMREHYWNSARDICNALLEHATKDDDHLRQIGEEDRIDDKTVFIIKRG
jgi:Stage II sporulation protein E (SpoIIE)